MNGFSDPFINRPVGTSLLALGLLLLGAVAFVALPVAALPKVDFPTLVVTAQQPGVDPATAASSLAAPLERRLAQIAGISEITSVSSQGGCTITVQFDLDRDINAAARDVQSAINASASELPSGLPQSPSYRKSNPSESPILVLSMTSDSLTPDEVYNLADQVIAPSISQVKGVGQAIVGGGGKSAIRVQVDPQTLASMGLSIEDVRSTLAKVNVNLPKGSIDGDQHRYVISSNDQLAKPEDFLSTIILNRNGRTVRLRDIGTAINSVENRYQTAYSNGKRSVLLLIFKQADANVVSTVDRIREILPRLQRWLPPGVSLQVQSDRTKTIRASVEDVEFTLLLTMALVMMVMFLFLRRISPTLIASVSMPLALAGTFGLMWWCDFSLNNLSLMALTISTGFVVDDSIVVIENIVRLIEKGDSPREAALKGARQIGFTVVSITLSLIAAFLPILLMGGIIGRLFHEFAVTLSAAVLISGFVSLTLTPMLCARFLKPHSPAPSRRLWDFATLGLCEVAFLFIQRIYATTLRWVLRHHSLMLVLTLLIIGTTVWLYTIVPKGFFPQQDNGQMMGSTEAAQDISFAAMSEKQIQIMDLLRQDPAIQTVSSYFGGGSGSAVNSARMFITLKPKGTGEGQRRDNPDAILARIRQKANKVPGVLVSLQPSQDIRIGGRMTKAMYQYVLQGSDLQALNSWAPKLLQKLRENPQLKDIRSDQQYRGLQQNVVIDRDAAARLGIQPDTINSTLYSAFGQRQVSIIYATANQYRVILEVDPELQKTPDSLEAIYIKAPTGEMVPLSALARFELSNTALSINHQGQFPAVTLSFNLAPGIALGDATRMIESAVKELGLPSSIRGSFAGAAQAFQSSLNTQPLLLLTALLTIYIVLGILYESFIHPLTILSTLPSAGLGALLAIILTAGELSIVSTIGILLLIGIVKKNAIMMVDFAIQAQRHDAKSPNDAIYEACIVRFRPILMTTMAALFGALPLAIGIGVGSEFRQPLGIAIVGGLIVSQILTLYTTPVIYLFLDRWRRTPQPSRA